MADIRINALATTAASTASDDYVAIDGSANGTRKLSAYSPTFGGNLTVSGYADLGSGGIGTPAAGHIQIGGSSSYGAAIIGRGSAYDFGLFNKNGDDVIHVATGTTNVAVSGNLTVSGTAINLSTNNSTDKVVSIGYSTVPLYLTSSYDGSTFALSGFSANSRPSGSSYTTPSNTSYGNLYFLAKIAASDTASAFEWKHAPITAGTPVTTSLMTLNGSGNLLIGTTTDSGNGKLQLATHTTSAGGIGFGTDSVFYRTDSGRFVIGGTASNPYLYFYNGGTQQGRIIGASSNMYLDSMSNLYLRTNDGTLALTLDSSQNATFAGSVFSAKSINIASGYSLTAQDSGNTYRAILRGIADDTVEIGWGTATPTNGHLIFKAGGTEQGRINPAGGWILGLTASAPVLGTNSTMTFELTSNTSLTIKVRGTDGTTRSVALTLA